MSYGIVLCTLGPSICEVPGWDLFDLISPTWKVPQGTSDIL